MYTEQPSVEANWPVQTCDLDSIVNSGQLHPLHPAPTALSRLPREKKKIKASTTEGEERHAGALVRSEAEPLSFKG